MPEAHLVSASAGDDAAFTALRDLTESLGDAEGTGIVGGQMISVLTAAFPSPQLIPRRTNDADGGIPTGLARTGALHERLLSRGYRPVRGNRYVREQPGETERVLDILVPRFGTRIGTETHGGRRFDAMPGLELALANTLRIDIVAALRDGRELRFSARVPSVEGAVLLKTYAWSGRRAIKDAIDLHNLFRIVEAYDAEKVGGWRLDAAPPRGSRLDASRALHELARSWEARPPRLGFDHRQLVASIRTRVAAPPR